MISRIFGLKQLLLQVNVHASFHLMDTAMLFGTERDQEFQNKNLCPQYFNQRLRPLGHGG